MSEPGLLRQSRRITQQLLDIVFPPRCAGCQKSGAVLCTPCRATFRAEGIQCCRRCGKPLPVTGLCQHCRAYQPALSGLLAVSNYQGALRSCIHALKYDGNTRLAEPLGEVLAEAYLAFGMQADVIISVPLHHERQQQRGSNHAHLLAEVCASHIHVPLRDDIVVRHRATSAQVGMKAHERQQNVAGAFDCVDASRLVPYMDARCSSSTMSIPLVQHWEPVPHHFLPLEHKQSGAWCSHDQLNSNLLEKHRNRRTET